MENNIALKLHQKFREFLQIYNEISAKDYFYILNINQKIKLV